VTVTHPTTVDEITTDTPRRGGVRADIQALRAIAVGAVMLFHLWPNRLTGGYVGVDVFFAISGFLITSHLLAEIDATGRLRPGRFWARRTKRSIASVRCRRSRCSDTSCSASTGVRRAQQLAHRRRQPQRLVPHDAS